MMGFKTNSSLVDLRLSKTKVTIENIVFLTAARNLAVNQLMEHKVAMTTKVASTKEPKWTTMMAKNVHQVVSQVVETLADAPKQEHDKLNLCLTNFETKESNTEKELV